MMPFIDGQSKLLYLFKCYWRIYLYFYYEMFLKIMRLITKNTDGMFGFIWILIIKIDQS